jgi:hypothetical protein
VHRPWQANALTPAPPEGGREGERIQRYATRRARWLADVVVLGPPAHAVRDVDEVLVQERLTSTGGTA